MATIRRIPRLKCSFQKRSYFSKRVLLFKRGPTFQKGSYFSRALQRVLIFQGAYEFVYTLKSGNYTLKSGNYTLCARARHLAQAPFFSPGRSTQSSCPKVFPTMSPPAPPGCPFRCSLLLYCVLQSVAVCCSLLQSDYESAGAAWVSLIRCFVSFKVFCPF